MSANMQAAVDEAGKVVKKQKVCSQKVNDCISQLLELVQKSKQQLHDESSDTTNVLQQLRSRLEELALVKNTTSSIRDFHKSISSLDKALEKAFDNHPDICKVLRDVKFDRPTVNKVIAEHLYREGRFDIADQFVTEAGVDEDAAASKASFVHIHNVLQQIKAQNLAPALEWAQQHRAQLHPDSQPSDFEFRLHSLAFLHALKSQGQLVALTYAKAQFPPFHSSHLRDIQRLMGCLVFARRAASPSAYAALMSPSQWNDLAYEFLQHACSILGQAQQSPLAVAVAAGTVALPQLLKLQVLEARLQEVRGAEQLPLEVELGREFVFRSVFACPVSRDQSSPSNPPMLLPCNHVLCEQSILKIAKNRRGSVFKCPYCPMEARTDNLRPLVFPDPE